MPGSDEAQVVLIKLADGARSLRFTDEKSGVSVERRLEIARPVAEQKRQLAEVFQAAVARAELSFA